MAFNTNNPVPSSDSRDLSDNAENFDDAVNLNSDKWTDRLGASKDTIVGRLKKLGYQVPVLYASGIVFAVDDNTKTVDESGVIYAPRPSALPFTTTGTWGGGDDAKFFVVQEVTEIKLKENTYPSHFATMVEAIASTDTSRIYESGQITVGDKLNSTWGIIAEGTTDKVDKPNGTDIRDLAVDGLVAKLVVEEGFNLKMLGATEGADVQPYWDRFVELCSENGIEGHVSLDTDMLTSDTMYIQYSGVTITQSGEGYFKLTASSTNGAVMVCLEPTGTRFVENIVLNNPRVDGDDFGHPKSSQFGENGVAGANCKHVRVNGGKAINCRRGTDDFGGKGIQFENGVHDVLVDGFTSENCSKAMESGGTPNGADPENNPLDFHEATSVKYTNMKAINCDQVVRWIQTLSPPNTDPEVTNFECDFIAQDCGRNSIAGTELDDAPVVVDRGQNFKISGTIFNSSTYGTCDAVIKMRRGGDGYFDIDAWGTFNDIVSHKTPTGGGTTGQLIDVEFNVRLQGTSNYAIEGVAADAANLVNNQYHIKTGVLNTGLVSSNVASANLYCAFTDATRTQHIAGDANSIVTNFGNTYPSFGVNNFASNVRISDLLLSVGGNLNTIGNIDMILKRNFSDRIALTANGINLSNIPTSSAGLNTGDVWNNAGVLTII